MMRSLLPLTKRPDRAILWVLGMLVFASLASPTRAETAKGGITVKDFGLYKVRVSRRVPAPDDVSGDRNIVSGITHFRSTRTIMAIPDRSFGYRFRITDPALYGKRLTLRTIFPAMTNPATKRTKTQNKRPLTVQSNRLVYDGYRFDHDWEMTEGPWIFQVLDGAKVILEQRFKVIVPLN